MAKRNAGYEARKQRLAKRREGQLARVSSAIKEWWFGVKYIPAGQHKNTKAHNR